MMVKLPRDYGPYSKAMIHQADLRWALWDSTMYIVRENPIFGIGWNTFYLVYPDYNYYIQGPTS